MAKGYVTSLCIFGSSGGGTQNVLDGRCRHESLANYPTANHHLTPSLPLSRELLVRTGDREREREGGGDWESFVPVYALDSNPVETI